jgi:diguanylate cyclase (GGDEF)-like protein
LETAYRRFHLSADTRALVMLICVWTVSFLGFAYSDYLQFGGAPVFWRLLLLRVGYTMFSGVVLARLRRPPLDVQTLDRLTLIWGLATVTLDLAVGGVRPRGDISVMIIDLVGVMSFYVFISNSMAHCTIPAGLLSTANLLSLLFAKADVPGQVIIALVFSYVITNVVGVFSSRDFFSRRRAAFLARREEARVQAELERLAATDPLTGVYNRRRLLELASDAFYRYRRYRRPFSILVMDMDGFKNVNDTFGHQQGDSVLIQFSRSLIVEKREGDALGRMGGDEFCLILPETEPSAAAALAERILARCGVIRLYNGVEEVLVTTSIGITTARPDDQALDVLFARADSALYTAKHQGRNRYAAA